jgi:hypothetical protein
MAEEFWESLVGSTEKRWLINVFGPALIFWGAGAWVWAQLYGLDAALKLWQGYATEVHIVLGVAGLVLALLTALLLESFAGWLLRCYEGYWPRWPGRARRRAEDLRRKQERLWLLRGQEINGQANPAQRAELARLDAELANRPRDPERSMPTRLGDILRSAEDHPRQKYGLDPIVLWPRLFPHLSQPLREALGATQDQLDLGLRLTTLALIYGVSWSIIAAVRGRWDVLGWTLPALPLAWLLWQSAHQAAISYAGLLRSAFDLHRFDVYTSMGWARPTESGKEKEYGAELTLYLSGEAGAKDFVYVHDEK